MEEYTDKCGKTIKVYTTDSIGTWCNRKPKYTVPMNSIGSIDLGENHWGSIGIVVYAGWDSDIDNDVIVFWEMIDHSQMQDDVDRLFLSAAIFLDEQMQEFDSCEPTLPYFRAGVYAIVKRYVEMYDFFEEISFNFGEEYQPFIDAIVNKQEIPCWADEDEDE